jgi:hypothetical protein
LDLIKVIALAHPATISTTLVVRSRSPKLSYNKKIIHCRVDRWNILKPKITIWNFLGMENAGTFYGHLVI